MRIKRFFATTVSITLLLLLGGVASYLMIGARAKALSLRTEFIATIYLQDTISQLHKLEIENAIRSYQEVAKFQYISKDQAASEFVTQVGTDFRSMFDTNPLPASYQVNLKTEANVGRFQKIAQNWTGVEEVTYPYQLACEVENGITQLGYYVLGFAVVLGLVLIIVLRNTVRMDVAASASDVARAVQNRMPHHLIRQPFMLRAYSQGAIAGGLASVFLLLTTDGIATILPISRLPIELPLMSVIFAVMIIAGMLLTTLFTYFAINTQIKIR